MTQWERHTDPFAINELGSNHCSVALRETSLFQNLLQASASFGLLQKQSNGLSKILKRFRFRRRTGRNVQLRGVSNEHSSFLENSAGKLNFHESKYSIKRQPVVDVVVVWRCEQLANVQHPTHSACKLQHSTSTMAGSNSSCCAKLSFPCSARHTSGPRTT